MMIISKIQIRPVLSVLALVVAVFFVGSAASQQEQDIFTWTDDEGVRHFSAYPPIDQEYERVETRGAGTARASSPAPETEDRQPPDVPEMRQTEPDPDVVAERCEQARSNLELLQQDGPAVLRQEEGEPTPLDDNQRQELIEETEQFIEQWC